MKKCISCGQTKQENHFYKHRSECRQCIVKQGKTNTIDDNKFYKDKFIKLNGKQVF